MRNAHIAQMDQRANIQILSNDKDVKIRTLEGEIEDLLKRVPQTPDKKRNLLKSRDSSTDGDYSTPRSGRNDIHRREKPPQVGQATKPKINPSQGGQVTGSRSNPSQGGQVTGPRDNPPQSGQATGPRLYQTQSSQVTGSKTNLSQDGQDREPIVWHHHRVVKIQE